jgi:hypothetical protein
MGIIMVLLIYVVVGGALACIAAAVFGGITALVTRSAKQGRRGVLIVSVLLPFACGAWAFAVFVTQAIINETLLNRDMGLGDTWHCPLPNGYQIMMIDVTDQGWVYNPKTQPNGGVGERDDAVSGVRLLQVAGRYILGAVDSRAFEDIGKETDRVDTYFLLDTQVGKHATFPTREELQAAAQNVDIHLDLIPIDDVYSKYRLTWFDGLTLFTLLAVPVVALVIFVRWLIRVRNTRDCVSESA